MHVFASYSLLKLLLWTYSLLKLVLWMCSLLNMLKLLVWMRSLPIFPAQAPSVDAFPSYSLLLWMHSLPIPSFCGCIPFLFPPSVDAFPSYSLLKLLLWMCSLPIPCSSSFCGCVPFLFPAQAPSVDVFPSYSLLKLLLWMCVPFLFPAQAPSVAVFTSSPCSSSFCGCVPFYSLLLMWICSFPFSCSSSCGHVHFLVPAQLSHAHTALYVYGHCSSVYALGNSMCMCSRRYAHASIIEAKESMAIFMRAGERTIHNKNGKKFHHQLPHSGSPQLTASISKKVYF